MTSLPSLAVRVRDMGRSFDGPPVVHALRPCSFEVFRGDFVAITGPSGSGKSTLLALLGLLDQPTSGVYELDGTDVARIKESERTAIRAHKIGFIFQAFHLIGYRSVLDNVELGLVYQGVRKSERRQRATEIIERVGLGHRLRATCSTLSGGEKQRVAIARTLVRGPSLVLCDEPTGNLDSGTSRQVLDLIEALNCQGLTVVVITHDEDVAARAGRRLHIRDGSVSELPGSSA